MRLGKYNLIELEQVPFPGNIGDSAAETSRFLVIRTLAEPNAEHNLIDLSVLVTDKGILRHPDSPWREDDTSSDQEYPLIAAVYISQRLLLAKVLQKVKPKTLGMRGQIRRANKKSFLFVSDLVLVAQALIFKLPVRYNDGTKKFESSSKSSADYLNFLNGLLFAKHTGLTITAKLAMKLVSKDKLLQKIKEYYKPEPNSQWLIDLYEKALKELYNV